MPPRSEPLQAAKRVLRQQVENQLRGRGYSSRQIVEVRRTVGSWVATRRIAARQLQPQVLQGNGLIWGPLGYVEMVPTEVPLAGVGQVTVLIHQSVVSPGTERAQYLHLPTTTTRGRPGYSGAGTVVATGRDVDHLRAGDLVAVSGAPHGSVVTVNQQAVYPVPAGASGSAAALIHLGVIAEQGARASGLTAGTPFCVLGSGLVGALTMRLLLHAGAGPADVVARSPSREHTALEGGARRFLSADRDAELIGHATYPVVIDATGDPEAILTAVRITEPGGRIVLLGSPRGWTSRFPVDEMRANGLTVVGAHVGTLATEEGYRPGELRRLTGERFLATVASGRLPTLDLLGPAVDPREAGRFYRDLAEDPSMVGAHFDWTLLPMTDRLRRRHVLAPPEVGAGGIEQLHRPLAPRRARTAFPTAGRGSPFELGDVFAGAKGTLRVGLIGCGDIAGANVRAMAAAPNVVFTACFDPVPHLAESLARSGSAAVAASAEELVSRPDVDAVLLSVPHHLHAPLAELAIGAGRHVIVEKPLAEDLPAAARIIAAARSAGVWVSVCFPDRYEPASLVAKRLMEAGVVGALGGSAVRLYRDKPPSYWIGGFSGRATSDWRSSRQRAGGGVLIMNLSHRIDLVRHLIGTEVEDVGAVLGSTDGEREVEDTVTVGLRYVGGGVGSLIGAAAVRGERGDELRLWGRDGQVVLAPSPAVFTLRGLPEVRTARWHSFGPMPSYSARALFLSRLATAVAEGSPPEVSAEDGLAVQAVIAAAYRAAETGRPVRPADVVAEAGR